MHSGAPHSDCHECSEGREIHCPLRAALCTAARSKSGTDGKFATLNSHTVSHPLPLILPQKEERRASSERRRNLLHLIVQFLDDLHLCDSRDSLVTEAKIPADVQVCDNVDLETMYLEFLSYYQVKFGRAPKIVKRVTRQETRKSARASRNNAPKSAAKAGNQASDTWNSLSVVQICANSCTPHVDETVRLGRPPLSSFEHFSPEWREIAQLVCRDLIVDSVNVSWSDVFGARDAKEVLRESVILPLEYPELFRSGKTEPWKCVLLHGPPGTGKTLLARALCAETHGKVSFFNISSSTIVSKWRGDSEKYLRVLFDVARLYSPSVIFFDEIEGLTSRRDSPTEHEASRRLKSEFLTLLDGFTPSSGVFVLCNTNLPWEIDPAFLRRFEQKILVDLPSAEDRAEIVKSLLPGCAKWAIGALTEVSKMTEGFTGDDLRIACKDSLMGQVRKFIGMQKDASKTSNQPSNVSLADFEASLGRITPTPTSVVERHRQWHEKHSNSL
ncbi:katanin p60 ATPase-containing subunit A-like 2 [Phlebotomus argentipes]|uniref:katanin p60 ATPase-containing subunit A-like 2 n=1 Tax=Phlebotomus argentipes TaxID=94469 RepID=UPI0028933AD6|nr:katanin p60 ATPase-containing subunit A-like 2 [Phlebotomus argentipes]